MLSTSRFVKIFMGTLFVLVVAFSDCSFSATYPTRPIEIIVAWPPGGGADVVTRTISKYAEPELGQQITVLNLEGGNGAIGYRRAATARPDGYTLMNIQSSLVDLEIQGLAGVSRASFIPIVAIASQTIPLITRTESPFKSLEEFVAKCKENPGKFNVGGTTLRSNFHQAAVLFMDKVGITFNYVPTKGSPETLAAMAGKHIDTGMLWLLNADPYIKTGEMRALVVFSDKRLGDYPDVPSIKEKGFPNLANAGKGYYGIGALKGTPPEVVATLERAFTKAYNNPKLQEELRQKKIELGFLSASEFGAFLDDMYEKVKEALQLIDVRK